MESNNKAVDRTWTWGMVSSPQLFSFAVGFKTSWKTQKDEQMWTKSVRLGCFFSFSSSLFLCFSSPHLLKTVGDPFELAELDRFYFQSIRGRKGKLEDSCWAPGGRGQVGCSTALTITAIVSQSSRRKSSTSNTHPTPLQLLYAFTKGCRRESLSGGGEIQLFFLFRFIPPDQLSIGTSAGMCLTWKRAFFSLF